jgi:hypothetical protein
VFGKVKNKERVSLKNNTEEFIKEFENIIKKSKDNMTIIRNILNL